MRFYQKRIVVERLFIFNRTGGQAKRQVKRTPANSRGQQWYQPDGAPPATKVEAAQQKSQPNHHPNHPVNLANIALHDENLLLLF
jgi:hypothetical protein